MLNNLVSGPHLLPIRWNSQHFASLITIISTTKVSSNKMCTRAIVPGWQVILGIGGQQYEVRTNETGSVVRWRLLESR